MPFIRMELYIVVIVVLGIIILQVCVLLAVASCAILALVHTMDSVMIVQPIHSLVIFTVYQPIISIVALHSNSFTQPSTTLYSLQMDQPFFLQAAYHR